jgi:Tfp pilus assembly protein PilN
MRPVNLIPPEDRRGDRAPLRSGPLSYVIVGALASVLAAVTLMVMTSNDIAEKEAEVDRLEAELETTTSEAERLAAFTRFEALRTQRESTLASLAQSRFDWERVMREMALIIPSDVTLTELNGSAAANADGSIATEEIGAPNLALKGCASSHTAVADFVAALEDIDGVTRVAVGRSEASSDAASSSLGDSTVCGSANTFDVAVAFDNATVSAAAAEAAAANPSPETEVAVDAENQTAQASAAEQTKKAKEAASIAGQVTP